MSENKQYYITLKTPFLNTSIPSCSFISISTECMKYIVYTFFTK